MKGIKAIGADLCQRRERAWMDVWTLSDITGVPVKQIVMIEKGDMKAGFEELTRLAWWFGLRIRVRVK